MGQSSGMRLGRGWSQNQRRWLHVFLGLSFIVPVPYRSSPALTRFEATAEFRNGFGSNSRGLSDVTGVPFSVQQNGTVALCDLGFSTDLQDIQSASVSCQILYDNVGGAVVIGVMDYNWVFFAKIDDEVYEVDATIKFNPTTEANPRLVLCFSSTCSAIVSSAAITETVSAASTSSLCDCDSSTGGPGTVFTFGSSPSVSSFLSSAPEGFVFRFSSGGLSSSSSVPEAPLGGTNAESSGANQNRKIFDRNMEIELPEPVQKIKNVWTKPRQLDAPLCLKYPPASSSSSSSSSSSFSSSSPDHSDLKTVSSSYISFVSSSSSSSVGGEGVNLIFGSSPFSSSSSSSAGGEGVNLIFGSSPVSSSSSSGCSVADFEWSTSASNNNPWSSYSYSSSEPEGFEFVFSSGGGAESSSSSSSGGGTTTAETITNSQGSVVTTQP